MKSVVKQVAKGKRIRVTGNIQWITQFDEDSKEWIAVCDSLGITVFGTSHSELVESIDEATSGVFESLLESGDLDEFLELRGWKQSEIETAASDEENRIDVPYQIQEDLRNDPQKALC